MYLKEPCDCPNYTGIGTLTNPRWKRDCFHQPCSVLRLLKSTGRWVIQNQAGYVRLVSPDEVDLVKGREE